MCRSLPIVCLVALATGVTPAAGQKVYWTSLSANVPRIARADLDGGNQETVIQLSPEFVMQYVEVDVADNRVYWSELDPSRVMRSTLTGQQVEVVVNNSQDPGLDMPFDLDRAAGHVYWAEPEQGIIRRTNVDGTNTVTVLDTGARIGYVAFEATGGRVYWSAATGIWRADLDGTDSQLIVPAPTAVAAVALTATHLYWIDRDLDALRRADFDGNSVTTLFPVGPSASDLAVDQLDGRTYWAETVPAGQVWRAHLDGTGLEPLATNQGSVLGIALDLSACSGHGTVVDGVCACDPGWTGANCECSLATCPDDCSGNGVCVCGVCDCDAGWTEADCSCSTVCPADCSGNGVCNCGTCACDTGWTGSACSCSTAPCPNDCSGNGSCVCGTCVCAPGWDGSDCSCLPLPCPGDCSGHGACGCGTCTCDTGFMGADCSTPINPQIRLFMARDGDQANAAITGATTLQMSAGETARVMVWLEDTTTPDVPAEGYQIIIQDTGLPEPGTAGTVTYVNNMPGESGGDSLLLDTTRPDWLYAEEGIVLPTYYNETPFLGIFGLIYESFPGILNYPAKPGGIHYICEFVFESSPDAHGTFELRLLEPIVDPSPASFFYGLGLDIYFIDEYQPLTIFVTDCGDGLLEGLEECDDGNAASGDGCSADCVVEFCGDGLINLPGETCDDGNTGSGDGCSATCVIEFCGDGLINVYEDCDDANTAPGDGCSPACEVEFGYDCFDEPSTCLVTAPPAPALSPIGMLLLIMALVACVVAAVTRSHRPC